MDQIVLKRNMFFQASQSNMTKFINGMQNYAENDIRSSLEGSSSGMFRGNRIEVNLPVKIS